MDQRHIIKSLKIRNKKDRLSLFMILYVKLIIRKLNKNLYFPNLYGYMTENQYKYL